VDAVGVLETLFPCGSITGAPKLRTMQIINELESMPRGLSMGAIGIYIPKEGFDLPSMLDLSVAIRTMVLRDRNATFNVGGGIVIDSDPDKEYEESWSKAKALLQAMDIENEAAI
jgi:anthranilate/para-aminobenzoate synthase component I